MKLSKTFSIDPESASIKEHNRQVREVLQAYQSDKPLRVPFAGPEWYGMHGFRPDRLQAAEQADNSA